MPKKASRVLVSSEWMNAYAEMLQAHETYYINGNYSIFVPSINTKFIDYKCTRLWVDLDGTEKNLTPSEAAKVQLRRNFDHIGRKWSFGRPGDSILLDVTPPRYWNGQTLLNQHCYYVDLMSAYWQLYRFLSLDVLWPRGTGSPLWSLYDVAESLTAWKPARNAIVGIARSKELITVRGHTVKYQPYRNPHYAPQLWRTIQQILHDIATIATGLDAHYVNTDCYIFNRHRKLDKFLAFLDQYDLEYRVVEGLAHVRGWGNYRVGKKQTKLYDVKSANGGSPQNYILRESGQPTLNFWHKSKGVHSGL